MTNLSLSDFKYDLPEELIAQEPLAQRSDSRLLVRRPDGRIEHRLFNDLLTILAPGTRLVYNDTRVIPGRLFGKTAHGGRVELMLLKPLNMSENRWQALGRPFRKLSKGCELHFDDVCKAEIKSQVSDRAQPSLEVEFNVPYAEFMQWMESSGFIPLPPYIERREASPAPKSRDRERYQTIYAKEDGSVAAPTAGLHFSEELWSDLRKRDILPIPLTLHVGGGTFLPVKTQEITSHQMHTERYRVSAPSWQSLKEARDKGHPLVAVGTTSLRCLESFAREVEKRGGDADSLLDRWLETDLFLFPKDKSSRITPWGLSGLITNFHQPESSLLMLVAALIGYDGMLETYRRAVEERYRFLSYGDASLLYL